MNCEHPERKIGLESHTGDFEGAYWICECGHTLTPEEVEERKLQDAGQQWSEVTQDQDDLQRYYERTR